MPKEKSSNRQTPLHTFKKALGEAFAQALWERHAHAWWDDYCDALVQKGSRRLKSSIEKPYRNEWIYLLLTDGFFEGDDLDDDSATRCAVICMRFETPMNKTHNHTLDETRQYGAEFSDLPNPASAAPERSATWIGAVNCWRKGNKGRFRPVRTRDARRHPGWRAAARHAARLCFEPESDDPRLARKAYEDLRAFCVAMNEGLADAGENVSPLVYLLHQELLAAPGVSDAYDPDFYEAVLAGYMLACVYGASAVYDYGLIQRRSANTAVDGSAAYDAEFEASSVRSSEYAASIFLVDSETLAPLSLVRTVDLDPEFVYLVGRAPAVDDAPGAGRAQLLLLPGGDSISRHAFSLQYDGKGCRWTACGSSSSAKAWRVAQPGSVRACDLEAHGSGDRVPLQAGSRIVLSRTASLPEGPMSLPGVMVAISYRYDQLDGGGWNAWALAEEFLSVGARDLWIDAFEGRERPLYVPEDRDLIKAQWDRRPRGGVPKQWAGYMRAAGDFLDEADALAPGVRLEFRKELEEGYAIVRAMAKRITAILSEVETPGAVCSAMYEESMRLRDRVEASAKRDRKCAAEAERAGEALFEDPSSLFSKVPPVDAQVPSKARIDALSQAMELLDEARRERGLAMCRRGISALYAFRDAFDQTDAAPASLRTALEAAQDASGSLRSFFDAWAPDERLGALLDEFDSWADDCASRNGEGAAAREGEGA